MHWAWATGIAVACAAVEAWLSGPSPFRALSTLNQPRWALPTWGWMIVGAGFYAIFVTALGRMLALGAAGYLPAALITLVLLTDGFWNVLLFRLRRFDWAFLYLFPYTALVVAAAIVCWQRDAVAGLVILPYLLFLLYDFAWTRALALRNPA